MLKFFSICVLVAAACIAVVVYGGDHFFPKPTLPPIPKGGSGSDDPGNGEPGDADPPPAPGDAPAQRLNPASRADQKTIISSRQLEKSEPQPMILQDGRVLPMERQEVPSERDGKLLILGTPVSKDEFVPVGKEDWLTVSVLGVEVRRNDGMPTHDEKDKPPIVEPFEDPDQPGKWYRFPRPNDSLSKGTTKIVRMRLRFRKLSENDVVKEGQLLGVINPAVAIEDLAIKQERVSGAYADVEATQAMLQESNLRLQGAEKAARTVTGSISRDDLGAAKVTVDKYKSELVQKKAATTQSQQELSGAWTTLKLYFIRSVGPGQVRTIYKNAGDPVRNLDAVLQIQNTKKLRVEAQVEVQDALPLYERLRKAEALRLEAMAKEKSDPKYAQECRARADKETNVFVEVTRPVSPLAVLANDNSAITCVAFTNEEMPRIVSGSEEGIVRIWERVPAEDRWAQRFQIEYSVPVRALACSGLKAPKNLLVTATAAGRVRLYDLNSGKDKPTETVFGKDDDKARHQGAVIAVAFNADASLCASAGEDQSICIWDTATAQLKKKKAAAHTHPITSLAFTPKGQLVSAANDRRLAIWDVKEDGTLTEVDEIKGRANDIITLGLDPTGDKVLFDEGRELRVISLSRKQIEGRLGNTGATGAFSTMALFSPKGDTILTNGNAPGRLQLWRAPNPEKQVRAAELRQMLWTSGSVTCGAFAPRGKWAVTGTSDHRVLVWDLPSDQEAGTQMAAELSYVEEFLDSGLKRVKVRATLRDPKDWVIPGSTASIVVHPVRAEKAGR